MRSKIFKCGFDINDYLDIIPPKSELLKNDFVLNMDEYQKGNIDNCVWKKYKPTIQEINSPEFRQREHTRILKTGVLACISEEIVWIPPNLYFALQYCPAGSSDMEFRLKRLKHAYFKIKARLNAGCKGTLTLKSRGDGETTMAITDAFWECLDGNMEIGQIGIQSRTLGDSKNPCWGYVQTLWQSLPQWLKSDLCSDFDSGEKIAEKMKWMRSADELNDIRARNILFTYYPSGTPMDGKHDMKKCVLDEICKWEECSFYDTFTNYSKFIMPGTERRGMFDMFSSPADKSCESNNEVFSLWKDSNPDELTNSGTTKSRVHRYYSNPLDGIAGEYDKFGDVNPEKIYTHILQERAAKPKDKLLAEIRGYPLNEEEMFGSTEGGFDWYNKKGISERKIYLLGTRFKNNITQEPARLYGNLEWENGVRDSEVFFRQADKDCIDVEVARFVVTGIPKNRVELKTNSSGALMPPIYVEGSLGIDPIDKRYVTPGAKGFSNAAMVNHVFRDVFETGINKMPTLLYSCRPQHAEIFFEDAIKAAVFCRSFVQTESINSKIIDYFEDRGYLDWMLSKRGQPRNSNIKGDSPGGGKNIFLQEIMGLINAITNTPLTDNDPYLLENFWFPELLEDLLNFNPKETHSNDITMAFGQSLMGAVKIMHKKTRKPSELNSGVLDYLLT